jgi:predicted O-linked N-acetylglucosamine transferase (SPINDLY family)
MGVSVVTLAGRTAVGRAGVSILSNVGLPELVAHSEEDYVRIAGELANNLPRLSNLHSTLRQRMENSPLMNAPPLRPQHRSRLPADVANVVHLI